MSLYITKNIDILQYAFSYGNTSRAFLYRIIKCSEVLSYLLGTKKNDGRSTSTGAVDHRVFTT